MQPETVDFSKLASLGKKSSAMLLAAGIRSFAELEALGSVAAYLKVKQHWKGCSLNMLWALEAALTQRDWRKVTKTERQRLLNQIITLES